MPNFKSDTVTAQELASAKASSMIADAAKISGKLHFIQGVLTVPNGTAVADTIEIVQIPAGVTIIPGLSNIVGASAGATTTLSLGFAGAATAISTAVATSTAGAKPLVGDVGSYTNATKRSLIATVGGAGLTAGVVLYFNIACVHA